jgi:asparagine synthase (glutamine-hydrolysing)
LRDVLETSVRSQLVADVPVGIFLSGGIDSSAILSFASRSSTDPIHTFTVTFDEKEYSEEKYASIVARRYGSDHHQVHLSSEVAASQIDRVLDALDQPSADGVNTFFVAEAARLAGLSVALSGLGGDELFAGYPHFRSFGRYLAAGKVAGLVPGGVIRQLAGSRQFRGGSTRRRKLSALLASRGDASVAYTALRSMFSAAQTRTLAPGIPSSRFWSHETEFEASGDAVNDLSRLEMTRYMRNMLLRDTDVMSMAHSLEVRVPLLDDAVVDAVAALRGSLKLSRGTNKRLLVDATGDIPPAVVHRPKMGFTLPLDRWFRGQFRPRLDALLNDRERVRSIGLSAGAVSEAWSSFLKGSGSVSFSRIWTLVTLLEWTERNGVQL